MRDEAPETAGGLAEARRELFHVRLWTYLLMAVICICPVVCCGLVGKSYDDTVFAVILVTTFAPVFAFGGLLLLWRRRHSCWRRAGLAEEAVRGGFVFRMSPPPRHQVSGLNRFRLLASGLTFTCSGFIEGGTQSGKFVVFDMADASQTVFVLPKAVAGVPDLSAAPITSLAQLAFGGRRLPVPGEEEFNERYRLLSRQSDEAPRFIGPDLAELCVAEGNLAFEVRDGDLLVYWPGELLPPAKFDERLSIAFDVARVLRAA